MSKYLCSFLIIVFSFTNSVVAVPTVRKSLQQQITDSEAKEAREVVRQYTIRFIETQDLAHVIKDLYFADFVERYKKSKKDGGGPDNQDVYFAPGLVYNARLLRNANIDDWQRLYVAANNFLIFGFFSAMTKYSDENANIVATDMFPASVIDLFSKNLNLENMIVRKGPQKPISSVEEMRSVSSTLEQAVALMRKTQLVKTSAKIQGRELGELMKADEIFVPELEVEKGEFFGFPPGTRIIYIDTLVGRRLFLARDDDKKLKVFWTDIISE